LSEGVTSAKNSLDALDGAKDIVGTVKDATGTINNLVSQAENLKENVLEGVSSGLLGKGLLGDVFETVTREASQVLNSLTGGISIFPDAKKQTILQNVVSGNTRLFTQSVQEVSLSNVSVSPRAIELASQVEGSTTKELINKTSQVLKQNGIPDSEIATITDRYNSVGDTLLTDVINSTISGSVVVDPLFDEPDLIAKLNEKWSGANTSSDLFTYIASVEELETEFTLIRREITEVVLHATDTFTNKNIGSVEINEIHNQLGHDGIGYHYIIRRDGRLQRGRPPNKVGEHTSTNNHNTRSLGVALVGGINASSGVKNPSELRSAQSFTREQFTTLEKFLSIYYQKYPGGQVFGHNDLDISEFDPYFDVPDYVEAVFRKKNITTDPLNTEPLKSSEIV
jgi:N-acetylmuramoyl-L-alanine amidase